MGSAAALRCHADAGGQAAGREGEKMDSETRGRGLVLSVLAARWNNRCDREVV